jgi:hypothetical protein
MLSIRVPVSGLAPWALSLLLAACSKEAPTPAPSTPPTATADPASSPLPGVIGQPSDVTAAHTPTAPSNGATAVGGLSAQPENGGANAAGNPAPTGGDAAPGHAASAASP